MQRILPSLLLLAVACGDKPQATPAPPAPALVASPSQPAAAAPAVPAAPGVEESRARDVVERWLRAQNEGDLATYEGLYAQRFRGEKRAGERLYSFDRAGWLADRKKMFGKPMKVSVEDVRVSVGQASATVELVQSFAQGNFADRGPKLLVLAREGDALKIASERMLASELASGSVPGDAAGFWFVVHVHGEPYVVLEKGAPASWGEGALGKPDSSGDAFAVLQATGAKLPAERAARRATKLRVLDVEGKSCEASVASLSLLAPLQPHFGEACAFEGRPGCGPEVTDEPLAPEAIAKRLWSMVLPGDLSLVGKLEGGCDGSFAVPAGSELDVWPLSGSNPATAEQALAAARKTPLYAAVSRDYRAFMEGSGELRDDWALESSPHGLTGNDALLFVDLRASAGCADFNASVSFLMSVADGKAPRPLLGVRDAGMTTAVLDLGRDGTLELLSRPSEFSGALTRLTKSGAQRVDAVPLSYLDCGC
jgi:hypothetical protein